MVEAITQPDLGKQGAGARETGTARNTRVDHRQLHILQRGGACQQIEGLEHESDATIAERRKVIVAKRAHFDAIETIRATACPIEAAEDVHEGRFPGAGRSHHGHELAVRDVGRDAGQRPHGTVVLGEHARLDQHPAGPQSPARPAGLAGSAVAPTITRSPLRRSPARIWVTSPSVMPSHSIRRSGVPPGPTTQTSAPAGPSSRVSWERAVRYCARSCGANRAKTRLAASLHACAPASVPAGRASMASVARQPASFMTCSISARRSAESPVRSIVARSSQPGAAPVVLADGAGAPGGRKRNAALGNLRTSSRCWTRMRTFAVMPGSRSRSSLSAEITTV